MQYCYTHDNESNKLALDGGRPVRAKPLSPQFIGANLIGDEEMTLVKEVISSKTLFRHYGPEKPHMVDDFEEEVKNYIGTKYALATATGTGAFFCTMAALELQPGDEVIIPTFAWLTDYNIIELSGAVPVFAEIDESLNLNPESFKAKITDKTKAVIVVHYQGAASRLDEIAAIAKEHNIILIEDVAQALGGTFKGRRLGTWGDVACYSFQGNKVLTTGDGGFLTTDNQEIFEKAVRFHDLGVLRPTFEKKLEGPVKTKAGVGLQWRMNELTGAVALAQTRKLAKLVETTRKYASYLKKHIVEEAGDIKFRDVHSDDDIGIAIFMDLKSKENVTFFDKAYRAEGCIQGPTSGCGSMIHFEGIGNSAREGVNYNSSEFKKTDSIVNRIAAIAIIPVYTENDIDDLATAAIKVIKAMRKKMML